MKAAFYALYRSNSFFRVWYFQCNFSSIFEPLNKPLQRGLIRVRKGSEREVKGVIVEGGVEKGVWRAGAVGSRRTFGQFVNQFVISLSSFVILSGVEGRTTGTSMQSSLPNALTTNSIAFVIIG